MSIHAGVQTRSVRRWVVAVSIALAGALFGGAHAQAATAVQPPGTSEATAIKVSPADLARARQAFAQVKASLKPDGTLDPVIAARVGIPASAVTEVNASASAGLARAACFGGNYTRSYSSWWQGRVYVIGVDSCTANEIKLLALAGAAIYAIIAAIVAAGLITIPGAAVAAIVAGVLALGAVGIEWCNRNGGGSEYRFASRIGTFWCVQQ